MYITSGSVIIIWTLIWIVYLLNNPPSSNTTYYFCVGFLATGVIVLTIGLGMGTIGRAAREAEPPLPDLVQATPAAAPAVVAAPVAPVAVAPAAPVAGAPVGSAPPAPAVPNTRPAVAVDTEQSTLRR